MNSFTAKQLLDTFSGPIDPDHPPNLERLTDWVIKLFPLIPSSDLHNISFKTVLIDGTKLFVGFSVFFNQTFSGLLDRDDLSLLLKRIDIPEDDPFRTHDCYLSLEDFPNATAFFSAVQAHPSYQLGCTYPFEQIVIRSHPAAQMLGSSPSEVA